VTREIFLEYKIRVVPVYQRQGPSFIELPRRLQHLATTFSPPAAAHGAATFTTDDFPTLDSMDRQKPKKTPTFKKGHSKKGVSKQTQADEPELLQEPSASTSDSPTAQDHLPHTSDSSIPERCDHESSTLSFEAEQPSFIPQNPLPHQQANQVEND
jgi:hypothetical protein